MCRNCGALIGAGESSCHVCGAPLSQPSSSAFPLHERNAINFARAVLSRPYIFTIVFLVANLFVFLLMWESSEMSTRVLWTAFPEEVLRAYGAKMNYAIHFDHEWWRLFRRTSIHLTFRHLLFIFISL